MEDPKKSKTGFFAGVKKEFGRVTWPTRKETFKQTVAVLVLSVLLGLMISGLDVGFSTIVQGLSGVRQGAATQTEQQIEETPAEDAGEADTAATEGEAETGATESADTGATDSAEEDTGETD